ncbi:MAG: hypothetical protein ABII97_03290 [Patescibacteria group bacterium]
MNIREKLKKIKTIESDLILVLVVLLVGLIAFGLGRLSVVSENETPVRIESLVGSVNLADGLLVASKNGSKYHYPWCSGAQKMKEDNKVWFDSKEEAERAGYSPASNCKGL